LPNFFEKEIMNLFTKPSVKYLKWYSKKRTPEKDTNAQ
jgi:hypothetical protein